MVYRVDALIENGVNPITKGAYDASWIVLMLTDAREYQQMCGRGQGCAYTIKISRLTYAHWPFAVGDFIGFNEANGKNIILVISESDVKAAKAAYAGHSYKDAFLRAYEPAVLIHSTPIGHWQKIKQDGMLKSWNRLKAEHDVWEEHPIGSRLGDPCDFSDYIMFGRGVTGEIIVNSKQKNEITMDVNTTYQPGARLYFDAAKIAKDGLLVRDGCHLKVRDHLPLFPYMIWAADWRTAGLIGPVSTPKTFAEQADGQFQANFKEYKL
ncbi:MAG: hypothetical protein HFE78_04590 [Clostridiales bacterium]|nr:hypothetical protein [Clostridiales bacterium]